MPLTHDPEYQKELDKIKGNILKRNRSSFWFSLVISAVILILLLLILNASNLSDNLKTSIIIITCTLVLIAIINSAVTAIHGAVTIVAAAVEWVGRKQLGEYKEPE